MKIVAVIQCTGADVWKSDNPDDYCISKAKECGIFDDIIMACGDREDSKLLEPLANKWCIPLYKGSVLNVCKRILSAGDQKDATIIVRLLLRQFYLDTEYLGEMINTLINENADYVKQPYNYNYALVGDVFKRDALKKVLKSIEKPDDIKDEIKISSYKFSPGIFIEDHPNDFKIIMGKPGPDYPKTKVTQIRAKLSKLIDENQVQFDSNYPASSYSFISNYLTPTDHVLDIACGKGNGCQRLAQSCNHVTGVDIDKANVKLAENSNKKPKNITFINDDAENFLSPSSFDGIISLHTLEHLKNPEKFLECAYKNLKKGGRLFLEVPLLFPHPLGMPLFPSHDKEYLLDELVELLEKWNFRIDYGFGKNRHAFCQLKSKPGKNGGIVPIQNKIRLSAALLIATKI